MKIIQFKILTVSIIIFGLFACNQQGQKQTATPEEIISAKTLGLAYLEESKLEEAEAEFLKLVKMVPADVMGYANLGIVYLRMASYENAEEWLKKAIKMDPQDPDVQLILAKVFEMSGRTPEALDQLEQIIGFSPGHVKSLYMLSELYAASREINAGEKQLALTRELVLAIPANVVPRLNLIDIQITRAQPDSALAQLEELQQIFPEFPKEAVEYFDNTLIALRKSNTEEAKLSFMIFHNYLKVTSPYQAGMMDLKGPGGSLVGSPVVTFDQQQSTFAASDWEEFLAAIKFNDITSSSALDFLASPVNGGGSEMKKRTYITASDYDGDGDIDLYAGKFDSQSGEYKSYLLNNDWGIFKDVSKAAGISHSGEELTARFADYDNDGFMDLYIVRKGSDLLYSNNGDGTFEDVSARAGVDSKDNGSAALFFDYDHDGDLDLFIPRVGINLMYRNNSDGTFVDQSTRSALKGNDLNSTDAGFGDFDEDGDIDLFVTNSNGQNALFSNQREGIFREITSESGLEETDGSSAISIGDYNNDGFLDIFVASSEAGNCRLYLNSGDGTFQVDRASEDLNRTLKGVRVHDSKFLDFDNDGYLDLMVVGESLENDVSGVYLYHSDGNGKFWLAPDNLPDDLLSGRKILTFDYNDDGDLDLAITMLDGTIRILRNDGGNNHHYIKMKLLGLRAGSAKNNRFGIGAKVEVRSGSLYQSMVVTEPNIHFGLGQREKAEVIRILWTNGVPQNMFFPGTDRDLVEEQMLKGSCPFLYTWNGEEYTFVKDVMWRSALGMPLGIMGESTAYAGPQASDDYIKIPGEMLQALDGQYSVQITGELWETMYTDQVELVVVDHPEEMDIFVDERLAPNVNPGLKIFRVGEKYSPISASDHNGIDVLHQIMEKDDHYVSGFQSDKYQGLTERSELVLELDPMVIRDGNLHLYTRGWIFPTDASINSSIAQSDLIQMQSPYIQAINKKGGWETIVEDLSIPMGKDKTLITDLSGKVNPKDPRIRIVTNMQVYWDHIFYTKGQVNAPIETYILSPESADLHYRGFSRTFRKGGRYGPHWFDYNSVSTDPKWRDLEGMYTRYGDVTTLLSEKDDMYVIKNAGDETTIAFNATNLPQLPEGWTRDFLIHSIGWVKDGDMNTASGQFVEPLPFHGMSRYPYGPDESYPSDRAHQRYLEEYNTREVTTDQFTSAHVRQ